MNNLGMTDPPEKNADFRKQSMPRAKKRPLKLKFFPMRPII